jgi:hypothetical protein
MNGEWENGEWGNGEWGNGGMGERGIGERGHILNNRLVCSCFGEKIIKPVVLCLLLYGRQDWNRSYV